jgi:hypothetical protein
MPIPPIRLNFFALSNQNISFIVYRQPFHGQPKQPGYYKAKLPKNDVTDEYGDYWVTTERIDGFERYFYSGDQNPYFTLNVIWDEFVKKAKSVLRPDEYTLGGRNKFSRSVDIVIERHPEGHEVIEIQPYYLKAQRLFGFLVDFAFRTKEGIPFSSRIQQLSLSLNNSGQANTNYYSDKLDKINLFVQHFKHRLFPISIGGEDYDIQDTLHLMDAQTLRAKTYVFGENQECNIQSRGINTFGPYRTLEKEPLFVCIFKPQYKDIANTFFKAITGKTNSNFNVEKWFGVKLSKANFEPIHIESLSPSDLARVDEKLESLQQQHADKSIIGIFLLDEGSESSNSDQFSPYTYLKYRCTKRRIPVQVIKVQTIQNSNKLGWSIGGIALQILSKLGGIPWKVKPSNNKCLIFGLGSAHKRDHNNKIIKHFAYSICLDSSGIYKQLNILGNAQDRTEYIHQLRKNIQMAINENMEHGTEKCVLHLPFKIKRDEIDFIQSGVKEISSLYQDVEFQFIKINTKNKFFGYADNNSKVPYESSYLQLSNSEYLVWFEGLKDGRQYVNKRIGRPVHIEFLGSKQLNEEKRKRYLQDIINLSGANWRGFSGKLLPISIFYPDIIAEFIAEFRQINPDEDIDIKDFDLPWFL